MAQRRRHTPEQIVRKLREADRLLAEGAVIANVARRLEVSEQTLLVNGKLYWWSRQRSL